MQNQIPKYVSTVQASKTLAVSVTTVKRWVDNGILPAHLTAGGHRRLLIADINRLVKSNQLPLSVDNPLAEFPKRADRTNPEYRSRLLIEAIGQGDADRVRSLILDAFRKGITCEILADRILRPVFQHIGHYWENGQLSISREHFMTQAVMSALFELIEKNHSQARTQRPVAIGGASELDPYLLPSLLASLTLREQGWHTYNLGPLTPLSAFRDAMDEYRPKLIWVSFSVSTMTSNFFEEFQEFHAVAESRSIAIAIGGRALTDELRTRIPYTTYGDGMTHLVSFARTIFRLPSRPKRGRPTQMH